MAERKEQAPDEREETERARDTEFGGPPTTGGSAPGGEPTGLRRGAGYPDMLGGEAGVQSGGVLPVGAGGGSGTGAGGLATGIGGAGGTRNIPHGAGRPAGAPGTSSGSGMGPADGIQDIEQEGGSGIPAAEAGEASANTGDAGGETEDEPERPVRSAGTGRRFPTS